MADDEAREYTVISRLVLLGATGDLAGRFLLPALARSVAAGLLSDDVQVVGAGSQNWDDDTFRKHVDVRLEEHATGVPAEVRAALLPRMQYRPVDFEDDASVAQAVAALGPDRPVAVYLALPPGLFPAALRALGAAKLPEGSRIAVEKPFGKDADSAIALNTLLAEVSAGHDTFRVDHVLAMPRVRNLLELRSSGGRLEPVWNGTQIEQIELLWEETLGLEGRADFFDRTGAVKDVMQNHLMQLLALVAMEPPAGPGEQELHEAKLAAFRSVRPPSGDAVHTRTRRARYRAGTLAAGTDVPGYADEAGVDPDRGTETWAELVLELDSPRWAGTRFVLRAGKALAQDRKGVHVHFRSGPGRRDDEWIELRLPVPAESGPAVSGELDAYTQVLIAVLTGGAHLAVSADEAVATWRIVDPLLEAWARNEVPLDEYEAGATGPA